MYLETKRSIQTLTLLLLHPKQIIFKLRRYHLVKNKTCVSLKHVLLFDFINPSNLATEQEHRHEMRTKHTKKQVTLKYFFFIFHIDLLKTCGDRISLPRSLIFCFLFLHSFTVCSIATSGRVSSDFLGNSKCRSRFHQNT